MRRGWIVIGLLLVLSPAAAAQVPNRIEVVRRVAAADPARFACAHTTARCGYDFIKALACELHKENPRFGLNGKRGNPADLSWDAINWKGDGPGHDPTNGNAPVTVIDVIAAAGSPDARPDWQAFTDPSSPAATAPGAWVPPFDCGVAPAPRPTPTPAKPVYPGDAFGQQIGEALAADYAEAGQALNPGMGVWFWRTAWDAAVNGLEPAAALKKHRAEWRAVLGLK